MAGLDLGVTRQAGQAFTPLGAAETFRLFVRLKLRLVAGNVRGDTARKLGFAFTLIVAAGVAVLGFVLLALLRIVPDRAVAADLGVVVFTVFLLGWTVVPLLAFGLDDTLDPAKLALLPLRTRQLMIGMFAGSVTGPWPLASLVIMAGAVIGLPGGVGGVLLGVVAVVLQFALCVVVSRLVTTSLSGVLRSRRGRDLLAVGMVFVVLAAQLPNLLVNRGVDGDLGAVLHDTAAVLRWTPPGMAAHAITDGGLVAVAELVFLALLVAGLAWLWIVALRAALVRPDASTQAATVRRTRGRGLAGLLPDGPLAAVVTKELKYARREPRGRVGWMAAVGVTVLLSFSFGGDDGPGGAFAAIGPAALGALMVGMQACNSFGIDGRSLWMNAVVHGSPRALRTDLAGRHLAVALIAVPLLTALAVISAVLAGDPLSAVPGALTAYGVLGVTLGTGAVTSVVFPYTVPERMNAFTGAAPGQGGIAFAGSFGAMIASGVLVLPVALPVLLGISWLSVLAVPYGAAVAWAGRRLGADLGYARLPDILEAVSKPS